MRWIASSTDSSRASGRNPCPRRVDAKHGHLGNQGQPGSEGRGAWNGPEGHPHLSSGKPADDQGGEEAGERGEGRALSPSGTSLWGLYAERAASRGSGREQGNGELQERAADHHVAKDAVSQGNYDTCQGRTVSPLAGGASETGSGSHRRAAAD